MRSLSQEKFTVQAQRHIKQHGSRLVKHDYNHRVLYFGVTIPCECRLAPPIVIERLTRAA